MGPILFDQTMLAAVQSWHPAWLTSVMKAATVVFMPEILAGIMLALSCALLVHRKQQKRALYVFLLAAGNILTPIIKKLFERPRPDSSQAIIFIRETSLGFPSGHAAGIVLFCAAVLFLARPHSKPARRQYAIAAIVLTYLVGFSRIYLGVHWPTDVLGGFVLGATWLVVARWLSKTWFAWRRPASSA